MLSLSPFPSLLISPSHRSHTATKCEAGLQIELESRWVLIWGRRGVSKALGKSTRNQTHPESSSQTPPLAQSNLELHSNSLLLTLLQ